jgi:ATP-binding protein involved in chromosome partitioning
MAAVGQGLERAHREGGMTAREHALEESLVDGAHELAMVVQQLAERAVAQGDVHARCPVPPEPGIESCLGERLLQDGKVRPRGAARARPRYGSTDQVGPPFVRNPAGPLALAAPGHETGEDVGEQSVIAPLARLRLDGFVDDLRSSHTGPLARLARHQPDLFQAAEVRTKGVGMEGQARRELADRHRPARQAQVSVEAVARRLGQDLVDLDRRGLGHRLVRVDWLHTIRTVRTVQTTRGRQAVPTEEQVREALRSVLDPEIGKPIEDIGMLRSIDVEGGNVRVHVLITIEGCPLKDRITNDVTAAVQPVAGVERVQVELTPMSPQERQALVEQLRGAALGPHAGEPRRTISFPPETSVIAIASGKGGVGKSSVTVNLAAALASEGHQVGVLDADVWGFSVPRMLGVSGKPVGFNDMILPLEGHGVKVISMGFFVPEEQPVIWRGPMLHKAIEQFLGDVYWGDLDFLLCDLPPGTGDVSISLASFLPGASMLVVTTPQEASRKVAERAGKMAERTNLRAIGVIENMSFFICPHCGGREDIFGAGGGREAADTLGVPLMAQVPLVPAVRAGGDEGVPIVVAQPEAPASVALREAADAVRQATKSRVGKPLSLTTR